MRQIFLLSILALGSCATKPDSSVIYNATKAANDASLNGHIVKDINIITGVYTDDAIVLPPGGVKPIIGIDSIRRYYANSVAGPGRTIEISTETTRFDVANEDNASQVGKYIIKYQPTDTSSSVEFKGEMLIVWKRVDGKWKIYLDMWH